MKNVQDETSTCFEGREIHKIKVLTILRDTLYNILFYVASITMLRSKVFSLEKNLDLKSKVSPSPRDRVKCAWGLGVKDLALEKLARQILASF